MDVRELEVKLKADVSALQAALGQIQGSSASATASFGKLAGAFAVGQEAARLFGEAMGQAKDFLTSSVEEAVKGQYNIAQLGSALASTGRGSAGAVKNMTDFADSLEKTNAISHVSIERVESLLLSYTNLTEHGIKQATQSSLDLAARFGIDASAAALKLGEALQNPETGMTRLAAVGVKLSASQTQLVKDFMEAGDTAKAQGVILDAVSAISGGAAAANARTLGGEMQAMKIQVDDAKESLGNIIGQALYPLIQTVTGYISKHQQFVISLMAGVTAGALFTGALIAIATAAVLLWAALGPVTILLAIIGALVGVTVFGAFQGLQKQMAATTNGVKEGALGIGNATQDGLGQAAKAAQDLADKLAKVDEQIALSNKHFMEDMADIVKRHQNNVSTLKDQLSDENAAYQDSVDQKRQSFEDSQARIDETHQSSLDKLNAELNQWVGHGRQIDDVRRADVQSRIDDENAKYALQTKQLQDQYNKDAANAQASHQKKMDDLQKKLGEEDTFLTKHAADVLAIQGTQLNDELDKLKESHAEQLASYDQQKRDITKSAQTAAGNVINAFNGIPGGIKTNGFADLGTDMGGKMAKAFKDSFIDTLKHLPASTLNMIVAGTKGIADSIAKFFGQAAFKFQFAAKGGSFSGGDPLIVGEQGPEAFVPFSAGKIVPNHQLSNQSINITVNTGDVHGIGDVRSIGDMLGQQLRVAQRGF